QLPGLGLRSLAPNQAASVILGSSAGPLQRGEWAGSLAPPRPEAILHCEKSYSVLWHQEALPRVVRDWGGVPFARADLVGWRPAPGCRRLSWPLPLLPGCWRGRNLTDQERSTPPCTPDT